MNRTTHLFLVWKPVNEREISQFCSRKQQEETSALLAGAISTQPRTMKL